MRKIGQRILLLFFLLALTGCKKAEDKQTENVTTSIENAGRPETDMSNSNTEKVLVTAEKFMEYYSITTEQVPKEYVQDFINEYEIVEDELEKGQYKNYILNAYKDGKVFGYNINRIFRGESSLVSLPEFMNQADVVMFRFGMHYGSEMANDEVMVLDLNEKKFTTQNRESRIMSNQNSLLS